MEQVKKVPPVQSDTERVQAMLDEARNSPMGRRLAGSGFDVDMSDAEQANAVAMHVLHQLQVLDAATRMLARRVRTLQSEAEHSESLFV